MRAFVGVGTGRCGTNSLTRIVGACRDTSVYHERYIGPWYGAPNRELLLRIEESKSELFGEVQCQLLPHLAELRRRWPDLPIVCMHRAEDEVVKSHIDNIRPMLRPIDKKGGVTEHYPVIDAHTHKQALHFWWRLYEEATQGIPGKVIHLGMSELNDDDRIVNLFDFLGIPENDRVLLEHRRYGMQGFELDDTEIKVRKRMGVEWLRRRDKSLERSFS